MPAPECRIRAYEANMSCITAPFYALQPCPFCLACPASPGKYEDFPSHLRAPRVKLLTREVHGPFALALCLWGCEYHDMQLKNKNKIKIK
jgi:hypothetical protein